MENNPKLSHRRGPWSSSEDESLMTLVFAHGPLNWVKIAQTLGSRTPKQCRERYHQNLKPTLNHDPITPEEGALIERLVAEIGPRWAEIARRLIGRSDNAVKNWWNGSQNRRKRLERRRIANAASGEVPFFLRTIPTGLPRRSTMQSPIEGHRQPAPWSEPSLPSPCSSDTLDNEACYTTSPCRPALAQQQSMDLPPLRTFTRDYGSLDAPLPSFNALTLEPGKHEAYHQRSHLLTAPNSPIQQQQQQQQSPGGKNRDSRMNLSALLD